MYRGSASRSTPPRGLSAGKLPQLQLLQQQGKPQQWQRQQNLQQQQQQKMCWS